MQQPGRSTALAVLLTAPALALLAPPTDGPAGPLLSAVATAAWLVTGWLALVCVLTAGSRLPGAVGRAAARVTRHVAPRSVRSLIGAVAGVSLVLGAPAALAEERPPTVAGGISDSLDWPGLAPVTATPAPAAPATAPTRVPRRTAAPTDPAPVDVARPPAVPAAAPRHDVTVRVGDSLWSIAERALGGTATERQVAQAWPRWWSANRAVVGDDPDLIHPGDRLSAP